MRTGMGASAVVLALAALLFHLFQQPAGEREHAAAGRDEAHAAQSAESTGSGESKPEEAASAQTMTGDGPWRATQRFVSLQPPRAILKRGQSKIDLFRAEEVEACAGDAGCREELRAFFGLGAATHHYEFVIATAPDPLRTGLPLGTDTMINAIEEGAGNTGWEFAQQWLPWTPVTAGSDDSTGQASGNTGRNRLAQPGILVFRHQSAKKLHDTRVLLVFVVGETPTGGIEGVQFRIARAYIRAFQACQQDRPVIRILGPSFSGSFYSLTELIKADKPAAGNPDPQYVIRSGTASSDQDAAILRTVAPDFHSANESLADQQSHFCRLLSDLGIEPQNAAYLVEGESGYGNAFAQRLGDDCAGIHVWRFPREISHLRNAYREAVGQPPARNAPLPDITFSLKDEASGGDSVPVYSETQTPLSQNAVLGEITNEIQRNGIRIVQAGATNVLDLLFIAKVLRQQCPDTRLVISFPDLLFVQALQSEPLEGMLALSTYPLFFERGPWLHGPHSGVTFSDMNSEGVYNATVLLLAYRDADEEKGTGQEAGLKRALADYSWNGVPNPPTWLMTLDHSGFVPVNVYETSHKNWFESGFSGQTDLRLPAAPQTWIVSLLVLASITLAACGIIFNLERAPAARMFAFMAPVNRYSTDSARLFLLFSAVLLLTFTIIAVYSPWPFHKHESPAVLEQVLSVVGIAAGLAAALLIATRAGGRHRHRMFRISVAGTWLLFLGGTAVWLYYSYGDGARSFFFSFRTTELQIGSSPAIPITAACLALVIFAVVHAVRLHLAGNLRPRLCTGAFDMVLEGQLKHSRTRLNRVLVAPLGCRKIQFGTTAIWMALAALFLFVVLRVNVNLASIDGCAYDALCIVLQTALTAALLATCWQFRSAWNWLHAFLTSVNMLPLGDAFPQLTNEPQSGPIWTRRLNLVSLEIPLQSARTLHDMHLIATDQHEGTEGVEAARINEWHYSYLHALKKLLNNEGAAKSTARYGIRAEFVRLKHLGASIAESIGHDILIPHWRRNRLIAPAEATPNSAANKEAEEQPDKKPANAKSLPKTFVDLAQSFVTLQISAFALYSVRQIQNLLWFLSLGYVLLTLSLNSYSFQSPRLIGRFLLILFAVLSYVISRCMLQMERDPILSRIAGTSAGRLNSGFYLKLVSYGALPVIGLIASQFPAISKFLFSWVQPALEALR